MGRKPSAVGTPLHVDHLERFIMKLGMEMKYERRMIVVYGVRLRRRPRRRDLIGGIRGEPRFYAASVCVCSRFQFQGSN